jgi:hypothetical protein
LEQIKRWEIFMMSNVSLFIRQLSIQWRGVITRTVGAMRQLSSAREAEKRWHYSSADSSIVGYLPDGNDVSTEAEESPLLRAVSC